MAPADVLNPVDLSTLGTFGQTPGDYYSQGLRQRYKLDAENVQNQANKTANASFAKIGYEVNEAAFRRRSKARIATGGLETTVPEGWPERLDGPLVWTTGDFEDESEYVYVLTLDESKEVQHALASFKAKGLSGNQVSRATFPLPTLGGRLVAICADVYEGRGFAVLRGLDPSDYSVEDLTIVYLGLSSYVGERRGKQDQRGSMLMHVMNRNDEPRDKQYSEDKPFHTDTVTDCLCLFTQSLADTGGRSVIASSWTVYNELAATRPDLIHVLAAPDWPFDTFGRSPAHYTRAVLFHHHAKIIMSFSRRLLVGHEPFEPRTSGIPGLTEAQAEALDAVHFIARKHEIMPRMQRGDLRFINNMGVLHRREAFANSGSQARHLVRVWLNNEQMCWKLPLPLRIAWGRIFEDDEREEHWDIEPPSKDGKILRTAGSCD